MPITKSAKKTIRSSEKKRIFNIRRKRAMNDSIKEVVDLVKNKKIEDANKKLSDAYKTIDKAAKRGVIKKNTASRKKSRLSKFIKRNKK